MAIRVALVEDDDGLRFGLKQLIEGTGRMKCVATCRSVEEFFDVTWSEEPQVILLDINLPGQSGADAVPAVRARHPDASVLMLTVYDEEEKIFRSLLNGAHGYLLKKTPPARLLQAIEDGLADGSPMSPEVARKVIHLFRKAAPPVERETDLTPHELRVLRMLADGYSYQNVGDELRVSINTVRNYIRAIYEKLHVHSKSQAVSKAIRNGWI